MDQPVLESESDRYVIVEYLAQGGMGAIYRGKKLGMGGFEKEVVLKQLLPEHTRQPKFIDLFLREARLSAVLDHANIVHTIDLVTAGEDYYIVMEYVRGADLRTLVKRARRRQRRFAHQAAVFIGRELLEALSYAHNKRGSNGQPLGLIHRDISPSNILVSGAGEVKLTDFGIAKAASDGSVLFKVKGKIGYMAPEQARGQGVDLRADLFSLGIVLWELLVGERLFLGDLLSAGALYAEPVARPSSRRSEIPTEVDEVILKALALEPGERFQSAEQFQEALTRAAHQGGRAWQANDLAAHLQELCGEDVATWARVDAVLPEGTGVIQTVAGQELDDEDSWQDHDARQTGTQPVTLPAVELTSVIRLREAEAQRRQDELDREDAKAATQVRLPTPRPAPSPLAGEETRLVERPVAPPPRPRSSHSPSSDRAWGDEVDHADGSQASAATVQLAALRDRAPSVQGATATTRSPSLRPQASTGPTSPSLPAEGIRPDGRRPLLPFLVLLLLVGLGVAVGVALSGPQLELIDLNQPRPRGPAFGAIPTSAPARPRPSGERDPLGEGSPGGGAPAAPPDRQDPEAPTVPELLPGPPPRPHSEPGGAAPLEPPPGRAPSELPAPVAPR